MRSKVNAWLYSKKFKLKLIYFKKVKSFKNEMDKRWFEECLFS